MVSSGFIQLMVSTPVSLEHVIDKGQIIGIPAGLGQVIHFGVFCLQPFDGFQKLDIA